MEIEREERRPDCHLETQCRNAGEIDLATWQPVKVEGEIGRERGKQRERESELMAAWLRNE